MCASYLLIFFFHFDFDLRRRIRTTVEYTLNSLITIYGLPMDGRRNSIYARYGLPSKNEADGVCNAPKARKFPAIILHIKNPTS